MAAQAVLNTMHRSYDHEPTRRALAAGVLRAAADQVVPDEPNESPYFTNEAVRLNRMGIRCKIHALAAELEGPNG
jgi:hypothetical protein